jgi:hypothetical protein
LLMADAAHSGECIDTEGAKTGFALERPGVRSEFRPSDEMIVHVANSFDSSPPQIQFFFGGLIEVFRSSETGQFAAIPLSDMRDIFPLKSGARRKIDVLRLVPKKKSGTPEALELRVTGKEKFRLGDCEYDVLAVKQSLKDSGGKELDVWTSLYAPELKAVLAKRYDEGTAQELTVGYKTIESLTE